MEAAVNNPILPESVVPRRFVQRICEELRTEEVWLFGSRAKGNARDDSDWDLLAVVSDSSPDEDLDLVHLWRRLRSLQLESVEVIPVRRSDFDRAKLEFGTLSQIVDTEGIRVWSQTVAAP